MQNAKLQSYLHFHFIVLIWGFTAVLGALISIDAIPLVGYRMGLASVFIFCYIKWKGIDIRLTKKSLVVFAIAGVVIALHWLTFFGAIKVSNVSITLAVMSTGALFTSVLEPLIYKRGFIWYELVFGTIVLMALYVIFDVAPQYRLGIGLALISAFLSAVFTLINGKLINKHNPTKISFYELSIGTLFIGVYLAFAKAYTPQFFNLSLSDWLYIAILASICTAYAFIASVKVMRHLSPYTIMLTINLEPVYGIVLAYFILGKEEEMSPTFYYGALIIIGVIIANGILKNRRSFKRKKHSIS